MQPGVQEDLLRDLSTECAAAEAEAEALALDNEIGPEDSVAHRNEHHQLNSDAHMDAHQDSSVCGHAETVAYDTVDDGSSVE